MVQSESDERQAAADLRLGDVAPVLLETFPLRQIIDSSGVISLRCVAVGTPLPQIRWTIDDQTIPNLSRVRVGDHVTSEGRVVSFVNISNSRVIDGGEVRFIFRIFFSETFFLILKSHYLLFSIPVLLQMKLVHQVIMVKF